MKPIARIVVAVLSVAMLLTLAAGTTFVFAQQRERIEFWFHHPDDKAIATMDALVTKFRGEFPQFEVEVIQTGGMALREMWERLLATIVAGASPDLVYTDPQFFAEWGITANAFITVESIVSAERIEEHDIIPSAKEPLFVRGKWWGVPFRTDSRGLFYNVDHYQAAGLDPTRGPGDIGELDLYAQRLTTTDPTSGRITQLGFYPWRGNDASGLLYFWAFGGDFFDWNALRPTVTRYPENREAMEWIQSYAERYGYQRPTNADFVGGVKQSMSVQSTTALASIPTQNPDLNFSVDRIPVREGLPPVTLAAGVSLGIPSGAQNPRGGAELALFLLRTDNQVAWFEGARSLPVRLSALLQIRDIVTDPREQVLVDLLPYGRTIPPLVERIREAMDYVQERMFRLETSPQAALEYVQQQSEQRYVEAFPE